MQGLSAVAGSPVRPEVVNLHHIIRNLEHYAEACVEDFVARSVCSNQGLSINSLTWIYRRCCTRASGAKFLDLFFS